MIINILQWIFLGVSKFREILENASIFGESLYIFKYFYNNM